MKIKALILSSVVLLANCGVGGSDSPSTLTGVFIDSSVINIGYRTATQNGDTNSRGEFKYLAGETVTFFIGDMEFPPVLAAEVVTPLDMADTDDVAHHMVINIIRLLQSLDKDGDPDNGINITQTAKDNAVFLDFDLSVEGFETQIGIDLFIANGGQDTAQSDLVDTVLALVHFVASLIRSGEIDSEDEPVDNQSLIGISPVYNLVSGRLTSQTFSSNRKVTPAFSAISIILGFKIPREMDQIASPSFP